ncbi:hypothetical protein [Burkholderia phage FLC9]|nr:hypothetical protein [Burkholderia phage FLC9]
MIARTPRAVLEKDETNELLLNMNLHKNLFLFENRHKQLDERMALKAAEFVSSQIGFDLRPEQVKGILDLYPHARVKFIEYGGANDTEVCGLVSDAVADFFLGCPWPTYGDKLTERQLDQFRQLLQERARKMGFTH